MLKTKTIIVAAVVAGTMTVAPIFGPAWAQTQTPATPAKPAPTTAATTAEGGLDGYRLLAIGAGAAAGIVVATVVTDGLILPAYMWMVGGPGAGGFGTMMAGNAGAGAGLGAGAGAGEMAAGGFAATEAAGGGFGSMMLGGAGAGEAAAGGVAASEVAGGGLAMDASGLAAGAGGQAARGGAQMAQVGGQAARGGAQMAEAGGSFTRNAGGLVRLAMQVLGAITGGMIGDDMYTGS